jgi:methylmalonyl-CoA mutase N-terminal domain/subunit
MGGMVRAIEQGYPQREIAESAYRTQRAVEAKEQIVVGVNAFVSADDAGVGTLYIDESAGEARRRPRRAAGQIPRQGSGSRLPG